MLEENKIHMTTDIHRSVFKMFSDICEDEGWKKNKTIEKLLLKFIKEYDIKNK